MRHRPKNQTVVPAKSLTPLNSPSRSYFIFNQAYMLREICFEAWWRYRETLSASWNYVKLVRMPIFEGMKYYSVFEHVKWPWRANDFICAQSRSAVRRSELALRGSTDDQTLILTMVVTEYEFMERSISVFNAKERKFPSFYTSNAWFHQIGGSLLFQLCVKIVGTFNHFAFTSLPVVWELCLS